MSDFRNFLDWRERPGGGFSVNDCDQLRFAVPNSVRDAGGFNNVTPGCFDFRHFRSAPFRHIDHAIAEDSVHPDHCFVPWLDQVDETKLHPGASCAAHRESHFILRQKDGAQHRLDFLHHFDEDRVQMADQRHGHGAEDGCCHVARAGAHQQPWRWIKTSGYLHALKN
jgi:hypothetical protein